MEDMLSLKWKNHCITFLEVLKFIRTQQMYSDVTLACEGKFYSAHKIVLTACSEYFREIFYYTECKNPVIVLKDIKPKHVEILLDYMYIGEVNIKQEDIPAIMKAAECLKIKGLAINEEDSFNLNEPGDPSSSLSPNLSKKHELEQADNVDSLSPNLSKKHELEQADNVNSLPYKFAKFDKNTCSRETRSDEESEHAGITVVKEEIAEHVNSLKIQDVRCINEKDTPDNSDSLFNSLSHRIEPEEEYRQSIHFERDNMQFKNEFMSPNYSKNEALLASMWKFPPGYIGNIGNKFKCPYCIKGFPYQSLLRNHIRIHTGEKPFACNYCSYHSNQKGNLKTHLTTIHNFVLN